MSTATATMEAPVRKSLPMEVSNVLAAYWLGVSLVALTVVAAFFVLVGAEQRPFGDANGATTFGWLLLLLVLGGLIGMAAVVANAFALGRPAGFQWLRIAVIVGIIVMLGSLAIAVGVPMLGKSAAAGSLFGPVPVLGAFLLILLAALPFLFLILALSQSRGDAVRAFFWPEGTSAEAGVGTEEGGYEEQAVAMEEEPAAPYSDAGASGRRLGETAEYRPEDADEFAATQEMSPKAQGLIYVDQELAGTPAGSSVYGPESSSTRALEAAPEGEVRELTPEGSDFSTEPPPDVVDEAEAEPPIDSIHDDTFIPSEPIMLPDSGVGQAALQPGSEPDERLIGSDPVIMVPEEGPPRKVTMLPGEFEVPSSVGSEPIVGGSDPIIKTPSKGDEGGPSASDIIIEEIASMMDAADEGSGKKKKDTKVAIEGALPEGAPPSDTDLTRGVKRPKK